MNGEVERARLKTEAENLKNRAEQFANAADRMARLCGHLAEYEKKRMAMIEQHSELKSIRIPVTMKFAEIEDDPPSAPEAPRIPAADSELDAPEDDPDDDSEPDWNEAEIPDDENTRFLLDNQDVIVGVMFCGTLQFSTCLLCAALDGHIWKSPDDLPFVPRLPLHDGCRCVLLPVTDMHEINSSKRPAEASDFWHDAAVRYARKYPNKSWEKLSASTKLKYYYEEQKIFEQETGRPAFEEIPQNTNFSDWLRTKPEELQRRYLGELRAKLFIEYNLNLIDFVDQTTWTLFSDDALNSKYISRPHEERNEPEMTSVKLTCPQCGQHYSVEIDPSLIYDDMDCPKCGGRIPVSAEPPPVAAPPAAPDVPFKPGDQPDDKPRLKCPSCGSVFAPTFDLKDHVGGMDCPNCGSGMRAPLEQYLVNRKPEPAAAKTATAKKPVSAPPPAAPFFFCCSMGSFIAADVAAISESPVLANSLYWSGVAFVLLAIYLKIQWK